MLGVFDREGGWGEIDREKWSKGRREAEKEGDREKQRDTKRG